MYFIDLLIEKDQVEIRTEKEDRRINIRRCKRDNL